MRMQMKRLDILETLQNGSLTWWVLSKLFGRWGVPDIDLFATSSNNVVDRFASWRPDPEAELVYAFMVNWGKLGFVHILPPIPLLPRILQKIVMEKATGILVFPNWNMAMWYELTEKIKTDHFDFGCTEKSFFISKMEAKGGGLPPYGMTLRAIRFDGNLFW